MVCFLIQMIKFEFKQGTWMNQSMTPSYRLPAPVAGGTMVGTNLVGANRDGTTHPGQPIAVQDMWASTSLALATIDRVIGGTNLCC
jgi:hypothetical protein